MPFKQFMSHICVPLNLIKLNIIFSEFNLIELSKLKFKQKFIQTSLELLCLLMYRWNSKVHYVPENLFALIL